MHATLEDFVFASSQIRKNAIFVHLTYMDKYYYHCYFSFYCHVATKYHLRIRPDITVMVEGALKSIIYLSMN